jgi:hypothetical protein
MLKAAVHQVARIIRPVGGDGLLFKIIKRQALLMGDVKPEGSLLTRLFFGSKNNTQEL